MLSTPVNYVQNVCNKRGEGLDEGFVSQEEAREKEEVERKILTSPGHRSRGTMTNDLGHECFAQKEIVQNATKVFVSELQEMFQQCQQKCYDYIQFLEEMTKFGSLSSCAKNHLQNACVKDVLLPQKIEDTDSLKTDKSEKHESVDKEFGKILSTNVIPEITESENMDISEMFADDVSDMFTTDFEMDETIQKCIDKTPIKSRENNSALSPSITSPVLSRKRSKQKRENTSVSKLIPDSLPQCNRFPSCIDDASSKDHMNSDKVPLQLVENKEYSETSITEHSDSNEDSDKVLQISKVYNVDTTFLSNGKKLKQTKLVFDTAKNSTNVTTPKMHANETDLFDETLFIPHQHSDGESLQTEKTANQIADKSTEATCALDKETMQVGHKQTDKKQSSRKLKLNRLRTQDVVVQTCTKMHNCSCAKCKREKSHKSLRKKETLSLTKKEAVISDSLHNLDISSVQKATAESSTKKQSNMEMQSQPDADETFFVPMEEENIKKWNSHLTELSCKPKSKNMRDTSPPAKRLLLDKFDKISPKKENKDNIVKKPGRSKSEREKLNGFSCWGCKKYYSGLNLSEEELKKRHNMCSRHRATTVRDDTPLGFWEPLFPNDESSILDNK